jgi:hypothetical protein
MQQSLVENMGFLRFLGQKVQVPKSKMVKKSLFPVLREKWEWFTKVF